MYAVIETGGKQYRVEVGTELAVELLDVEPGQEITLDRVLLVADGDEAAIGRPVVAGAAVAATVLRQERGDKVISFKYKPKTRRRVKKGHRQEHTILRVTDVRLNGKSAAAEVAAADEARATEQRAAAAAAAAQAEKDAALAAVLAAKAEATAAEATAAEAEAAQAPKKATRTRAKAPVDTEAEPAAPAEGAAAPEDVAPADAAEAETSDADGGDADAASPEDKPTPRRGRAPKKED